MASTSPETDETQVNAAPDEIDALANSLHLRCEKLTYDELPSADRRVAFGKLRHVRCSGLRNDRASLANIVTREFSLSNFECRRMGCTHIMTRTRLLDT